MNKKLLLAFVLIVIIGAATYMFILFNAVDRPSPTSGGKDSIGCATLYDPVCGVDGATYSNDCVATRENGVAVAYRGACRPPSLLTADERTYLLWLLRERDASGFESVPVRHLLTAVSPSVPDSTFYTYEWDGGTIEIEVNADGEVIGATDSTGFNYLSD